MIFYDVMPSPLGRLTLAWSAEDDALAQVLFEDEIERRPGADWSADARRLARARRQLDEYFAGARRAFDLPLALRGTPFQRRVWEALLAIPFGGTASYGEIAASIGAPNASRAVGGANHRNPIPIIVPCHRVIGADGSLTGYGGGEPRKRHLLDLEGRPQLALPLQRAGRADIGLDSGVETSRPKSIASIRFDDPS